MKKVIFILCLVICPLLFIAATISMSEAENMADRIYSKIKVTVADGYESLTRDDYTNMYGLDNNGAPVYKAKKYPNDLCSLPMYDDGEPFLRPESYFGEIEEYVQKCSVDFEYKITGSKFVTPAQLRKNEDEPEYANVTVKTTWTVNGKAYTIYDDVQINLRRKCVSAITNGNAPLEALTEESEDDMMAKAAGLYDKARYNEAATLYTKIVDKYPNNDDAWYSLGVMYFKMQGVGKLSNKQRLQKAYDCWKHSNLKKARRAISYITDGRE